MDPELFLNYLVSSPLRASGNFGVRFGEGERFGQFKFWGRFQAFNIPALVHCNCLLTQLKLRDTIWFLYSGQTMFTIQHVVHQFNEVFCP